MQFFTFQININQFFVCFKWKEKLQNKHFTDILLIAWKKQKSKHQINRIEFKNLFCKWCVMVFFFALNRRVLCTLALVIMQENNIFFHFGFFFQCVYFMSWSKWKLSKWYPFQWCGLTNTFGWIFFSLSFHSVWAIFRSMAVIWHQFIFGAMHSNWNVVNGTCLLKNNQITMQPKMESKKKHAQIRVQMEKRANWNGHCST